MIKATELRVGNLVYCKETIPFRVQAISKADMGDLMAVEADFFDPIPLTPEILEKCGFKDATNGYRATGSEGPIWRISSPVRGQYIDIYEDWHMFEVKGYFLGHFEYKMKYLHQLQNLFFSLTGEELNVNI